ncbi:Gfo/Idh/MocA family protein [Amorphus sp. MBR-141]
MEIEGHRDERSRRIRLGMVGGGQDAFIGAVHRIAARLDDNYVLVAGALSASAEKAVASGRALGLNEGRIYTSYMEMAQSEAARPDGIEAVAIVTPNHLHFEIATAFLEQGIHVICDKPLATSLEEAKVLAETVARTGLVFALTHTYAGYPMVREARQLIGDGALGDVRVVRVDYAQDWLAEPIEKTGQKQAAWRTDPAQAGAGGSIGDIGTHAFHLACFVSDLRATSVAADLSSFVAGRQVDDNAHILLRFERGARGMIWASQVAVGNENALQLQVYGTRGGLTWHQEEPNRLWFTPIGEPKRLITRGGAGAGAAAHRVTRIPAGHPEGYLEAFANLYTEVAQAIRAARTGEPSNPDASYPTLQDGVRGMAFIEACVASNADNAGWIDL